MFMVSKDVKKISKEELQIINRLVTHWQNIFENLSNGIKN
mgnify:CR=1 FL=1